MPRWRRVRGGARWLVRGLSSLADHQDKIKESQGQGSLFRVLKALSVFDPEVAVRARGSNVNAASCSQVGFCQGMPFVAGMLLMYMSEEVRLARLCRAARGDAGARSMRSGTSSA